MKWFRDRGYLGPKSKGYNAKMKRVVKEHPLRIRDILRNKKISSKKLKMNDFCSNKKIS
jgi:IS5 family transposase